MKPIEKEALAGMAAPQLSKIFNERVKEIVSNAFPADRWDIIEKGIEDGETYPPKTSRIITIKFPLITVTNSRGLQHTIEDIYVRLFTGERRLQDRLRGKRGKLTSNEYVSDYAHSHLPGNTNESFHNFCLGGETSIAHMISELQADHWEDNPRQWELNFEAVIYQLETYLSWESIEGTPFRRIENISGKAKSEGIGHNDIVTSIKNLNNLLKINPEYRKEFKFAVDNETGEVNLLMTESVESVLEVCATQKMVRDHLGNFYTDIFVDRQGRITDCMPFLFQGQYVYGQFSNFIASNENKRQYAHRGIVREIKRKLETQFKELWFYAGIPDSKEALRNASLTRQREARDSAERLFKDFTVVSTGQQD